MGSIVLIPMVRQVNASVAAPGRVVELDAGVAAARAEFECAYARWQDTGCPHDRDAALQLKARFEDACRERRALIGDTGFRAAA